MYIQYTKKTSIEYDLPKFQDATMRLIDTMVLVWDRARIASYEGIKRTANCLIDACFHASSLESQDLLLFQLFYCIQCDCINFATVILCDGLFI